MCWALWSCDCQSDMCWALWLCDCQSDMCWALWSCDRLYNDDFVGYML